MEDEKIDKKDYAIFLQCVGADESEEEDEDDVSKNMFVGFQV